MKVVLFDLDGTLVNAGGAGRKALNKAVRSLYGVDKVCSEFSLAGRTDKDNFRLAFMKAKGRKPRPAEVARIERAYLRALPGEVRSSVKKGLYKRMPGIGRLIRTLRRKPEVALGLGTGNVENGAAIKLGPSGLLGHFPFGGFGSDGYTRVRVLKTAVRRAASLHKTKIRPADVFIIGDTHKDVAAGRKAGYHTGVVTCGFGDLEAIRKAGPELIAPDFRDLKPWLSWIGG